MEEGGCCPPPPRAWMLGAGLPEMGEGWSPGLPGKKSLLALLPVVGTGQRGTKDRWLPRVKASGDTFSCVASTRGSLLDFTNAEGASLHLSGKVRSTYCVPGPSRTPSLNLMRSSMSIPVLQNLRLWRAGSLSSHL